MSAKYFIKIKNLLTSNKLILSALLFAFVISILSELKKNWNNKKINNHQQKQLNADTYIPEGFVLVPIEIKNIESLDALIGSHGVVDLFSYYEDPNIKPKKIANNIKIIRAPLDKNQFAVLSPEDEATKLIKYKGLFYVVIQNPKKQKTKFYKKKEKINRIFIENN